MINIITCSMLDPPSNSDHNYMDNGVSKSTFLEFTIKHLMEETSLWPRAARNLASRGKFMRSETSVMAKITLKEMMSCSRYQCRLAI